MIRQGGASPRGMGAFLPYIMESTFLVSNAGKLICYHYAFYYIFIAIFYHVHLLRTQTNLLLLSTWIHQNRASK